jgi:hypothetical protein
MAREKKFIEYSLPENELRQEYLRQLRGSLTEIFRTKKIDEEMIKEVIERIEPIGESGLMDKETFQSIKKDLAELASIKDEKEFVERATSILSIFIDIKIAKPKEYEVFERKMSLSRGTKLSEILYYIPHYEEGYIELHNAPALTLENEEVSSHYNEAFTKLAEILENDPRIKLIKIDSWIAARYPRLIERLGFKVLEIYEDRSEKIGLAEATREDFLNSKWIQRLQRKRK